jgi:hypothetical protein
VRLDVPRYESLQPEYSLHSRAAYEQELEPLCHQRTATCGSPTSGLYGAFFVKGYHAIFVFLVIPFFCSTRAASVLPPRPHISIVAGRNR